MKRMVVLVAVVFAAGACLWAQEVKQDPKKPVRPEGAIQSNQPGARTSATQSSRGDSQIAACLAIENQGEIDLGKFAAERASNEEVKKFAEMMVKDHTAFLAKLRRFTPTQASTDNRLPAAGAPARREESGTVKILPKTDPQTKIEPQRDAAYLDPNSGGIDFIRIKQEIADECLKSVKRELESKGSDEFDLCFTTQQAMAHMQMADALKVLKKYGTSEFRTLLEEGEAATQSHLDQAKHLAKKLADDAKRSK
jgi:predicted outer membrane protein